MSRPDVAAEPLIRWPLLQLLRPKQWIKNLFVLAPLLFAAEFTHWAPIGRSLLTLGLFCVASSATYVFNDLRDIDSDRQHPTKRRKRPLAAGLITPATARGVLALLWLLVAGGVWLLPAAGAVVVGYLVLNLAYSLRLKHVPVVDLFCIAAGFVLRVFAGAQAIGVPVSSWMFITTLCLALYLAAVKRRQEMQANGAVTRSVLQHYTLPLLEQYALVAGVGAMVFYALFASTVRPGLVGTVPVVMFGLFRYWFIVHGRGGGESPTDVLWSDWPLAATVLIWAAICVYAMRPV